MSDSVIRFTDLRTMKYYFNYECIKWHNRTAKTVKKMVIKDWRGVLFGWPVGRGDPQMETGTFPLRRLQLLLIYMSGSLH